MHELFGIPEAVLVATVTSIGGMIVATVGGVFSYLANAKAGAANKHAKGAEFAVTNSHKANIRDDLDEKHDCLNNRIDGVAKKLDDLTDVVMLVIDELPKAKANKEVNNDQPNS